MRPRVAVVLILVAAGFSDGSARRSLAEPAPAGLSQPAPDYRAIVSRADLRYDKPVSRSEEGMPLGNGRMGSLVWTSAGALKFQINRVDVQPMNRDTVSFFERNTDYMGGCGFVDIEVGSTGPDAWPSDGTTQHLSVYDGLLNIAGRDLSARLLAWHARDVMAIEIDDRRDAPQPIQVNLCMLRFLAQYFGGDLEKMIASRTVTVRTGQHTVSDVRHVFRHVRQRDGRRRTAMGQPRNLHP